MALTKVLPILVPFDSLSLSTVENTVSKKNVEKMKKLDSLWQSIPKKRKIDDSAAVNLTFTGNPVLGNSSVEVYIDGLFMPTKGADNKVSGSHSSSHIRGVNRMVTISIDEEVFNSATLVYFSAKVMHVVIAETKNGLILSTSDWKLLPDLYKLYPEDKMMLDMSVTSPPAVQITENGIGATFPLEITINVQDFGKVRPVACLSSVLNVAGSAEIAKSNLIGNIRLIAFNATVKWNKIGEFQSKYVEAATSRVLEALFLPYMNTRLQRGYSLPIHQKHIASLC